MGNSPACIETLERRRLLSMTFNHHELTINGCGTAPNTIVVGVAPGDQSINATLTYPWHRTTRSFNVTIPLSMGIARVNINGGRLSDSITVNQTYGGFPVATHIVTGNGNDTVVAGDEISYVQCGNGIDVVSNGDASDTVLAGHGPDTIIAGNGSDHIRLGRGHDLVVAGNGTDTFTDAYGKNTISAGSGDDIYIMKNQNINLDTTDYNPAKDKVKLYIPPSTGNDLTSEIIGDVLDYLL